MPDAPLSARPERKGEFLGVGCLVQGAGIIAPFAFGYLFGTGGAVTGVVLLLVLFLVGSRMAIKWRCGNCKNPLASKDVQICPVCKVSLR